MRRSFFAPLTAIVALLSGGGALPPPAIGDPVLLGTASVGNAVASTAVVTTGAASGATDAILVLVASTGDTPIASIADSASNAYGLITSYAGGGSGTVMGGGLFKLTGTALASGATVTVTFGGGSPSNGRKMVEVWAIPSTATSPLGVVGGGATGNSAFPAITTSTVMNAYSRIRGIEKPSIPRW